MVATLANWVLSALAILIVANVVPGFKVDTFTTALIVALVLGIINAVIKPILLVLAFPINMVTFGLFTFVINAALILAVSKFISGFTVVGFIPALLAAVLLWAISWVINFILFPVKAM